MKPKPTIWTAAVGDPPSMLAQLDMRAPLAGHADARRRAAALRRRIDEQLKPFARRRPCRTRVLPSPPMETDIESTKPIGHMNNPSGEIVKVARELVDKWRNDTAAAELRAEELRKELEAERAKTPDARLEVAATLIDALKEIVDHAVANLSPEFIRDLPGEAFEVAARNVDKVVGATQRDSERATVWAERARIIADWRDRRGTPEWAERVAEYKEKQLREQAQAAGYTLMKLASKTKPTRRKTPAKTKAKPNKRKAAKRR
jgi:hypothetical protein